MKNNKTTKKNVKTKKENNIKTNVKKKENIKNNTSKEKTKTNFSTLLKSSIKLIIIVVLSLIFLLVGAFTIGFTEAALVVALVDTILFILIKLSSKKKKTSIAEKLKTLLIVGFGCAIIFLLMGVAFVGYIVYTSEEFDPSLLYNKEASVLYDKNGEEITKLSKDGIRENITYDQMSQSLIDAVIATEDSRFFQHSGVDLPRFIKASISQVMGKGGGGASTLTMQVSKNIYTSTEDEGIKGIIRKFNDIYISVFKIETHYTKEEILEFYLNYNNLGRTIRGVEQASLTYFGKSASELNVSESAMLAGMFQAPNGYDPYLNPEACEERRLVVLSLMLRHGYITQQEYDIAKELSVSDIVVPQENSSTEYQVFIDTVIKEVKERTGHDPYEVPMKIYTTMDRSMQDNMNAVFDGTKYKWKDDVVQAGSVVLDVNTGAISAIGGGRNYVAMGTNFATDIQRQIGSTAKPLYDYGPYMEYNNGSTYTIFSDEPHTYSSGMKLQNWDNKYQGADTLWNSLKYSRNIPAVKAFQSVNNANIKKFVTNLNLNPEIDSTGAIHESHALGGYTGESPLSMAAAYAAFSNGGYYNEPHSFTKIEYTETGEEYIVKPIKRKAMSESTAYMITKILENTSGYAIGRSVNGVNYCGKTGTTNLTKETIKAHKLPSNAIRDRWIASYNDSYAVTVWYGYEYLNNEHYLTSSQYQNKDLFQAIAKGVYKKKSTWKQPSSVVKVEVETELPNAMLASEFTPDDAKTTAYFKKGTEPTQTSTRFTQLSNVTNLKYENGIISWTAIQTPEFIDPNYITNLYKEMFNNEEQMQKEINERLEYNNTKIGNVVYEVYIKDATGALTLLGTTADTIYHYNGNGTIVVKTAYSIFKNNASTGAEILVQNDIITSEINGSSTINLKVNDTYIGSENPILVLKNGVVDITNEATITYVITRKSDNATSNNMSFIDTTKIDTYTIKYTVRYQNYSNTLTKIIDIKASWWSFFIFKKIINIYLWLHLSLILQFKQFGFLALQ